MSRSFLRWWQAGALAGLLAWAAGIGMNSPATADRGGEGPASASSSHSSAPLPATVCAARIPGRPELRLAYITAGLAPGVCPAGHVLHSRSGHAAGHMRPDWRRWEAEPDAAAPVLLHGRRPVIFVHGTPGSAGAFAGYLRRRDLVDRFLLISIDRPGFGLTRPKRAEPALQRQAAAITGLLAALPADTPPAVLVGHSLGGPIIAAAAARAPARIGGLVVLAGAFDPAFERVHPLQYLGEAPPFVWLLSRSLRNANRELIPLKGELERLRPALMRLHQPVLVLHGTRDRLVPYGNVAYLMHMAKRVPRFEVRPLAGFDHFIPWTAPDAVAEAIREMDAWLAQLSRRRRANADRAGAPSTSP